MPLALPMRWQGAIRRWVTRGRRRRSMSLAEEQRAAPSCGSIPPLFSASAACPHAGSRFVRQGTDAEPSMAYKCRSGRSQARRRCAVGSALGASDSNSLACRLLAPEVSRCKRNILR